MSLIVPMPTGHLFDVLSSAFTERQVRGVGLYEDNSVLNIFYQGVRQGWYPPLTFLGIGAMTDFTALLANPKLVLIGAAAQFGIIGCQGAGDGEIVDVYNLSGVFIRSFPQSQLRFSLGEQSSAVIVLPNSLGGTPYIVRKHRLK